MCIKDNLPLKRKKNPQTTNKTETVPLGQAAVRSIIVNGKQYKRKVDYPIAHRLNRQ